MHAYAKRVRSLGASRDKTRKPLGGLGDQGVAGQDRALITQLLPVALPVGLVVQKQVALGARIGSPAPAPWGKDARFLCARAPTSAPILLRRATLPLLGGQTSDQLVQGVGIRELLRSHRGPVRRRWRRRRLRRRLGRRRASGGGAHCRCCSVLQSCRADASEQRLAQLAVTLGRVCRACRRVVRTLPHCRCCPGPIFPLHVPVRVATRRVRHDRDGHPAGLCCLHKAHAHFHRLRVLRPFHMARHPPPWRWRALMGASSSCRFFFAKKIRRVDFHFVGEVVQEVG